MATSIRTARRSVFPRGARIATIEEPEGPMGDGVNWKDESNSLVW
jgi:hypothetical protein